MDLYKQLLIKLLSKETVVVHFENFDVNPADLLELTSYNALQKIKAILEDDSLADTECCAKIEEIVCLFEQIGSGCGRRHDWG